MVVEKRKGVDCFGCNFIGNYSKLIDIFNEKTVYEKFSTDFIKNEEHIVFGNKFHISDWCGYLTPIMEVILTI